VGRFCKLALTVAAFLPISAAAANAGPCTAEIQKVEAQIRRAAAMPAPAGTGEPTAPQSIGAQLHHQPTSQSVKSAVARADADAAAALDRARRADAEGKPECRKELEIAKQLYGIY